MLKEIGYRENKILINAANVFGESVENSTKRGNFKEPHWGAKNRPKNGFMNLFCCSDSGV
jgi:hypothetical protein